MAFRERLDAAHTRAMARAEQAILTITSSAAQGHSAVLHSALTATKALPISGIPVRLADGSGTSSSTSGSISNTSQQAVSSVPVTAHTNGSSSTSSSQLQAKAGALQGSKEGAAASLRFNEDLATRPAWYPPTSAPLMLAPAVWWEGAQSHMGQAAGRCDTELTQTAAQAGGAKTRVT